MEMPRNQLAGATAKHALIIPTITAAAGNDNTEINGVVIDRQGALTAKIIVTATATLAAGKKLEVNLTLQDGDASNLSDAADIAATLQPLGAADSEVLELLDSGAGSTMTGQFEMDISLDKLKRYMRVQAKGNLDAAGVDTATIAVVVVLGGKVIES